MLLRDMQRLALAVALTIVLLYSISVCFAGDKPPRDWITYTSDDLDKVDAALHHHGTTTHDIPIPLPDPKAIPKDDSSGDKITLKEPPGKGHAPPADKADSEPMAAKEQQDEAVPKDDAPKAPEEVSSSERDLSLS